MKKFAQYIREVRTEMTHVTWPTKNEAMVYTALVVVLSAVVAVFAGVLDAGLVKVLALIIN